MSTNMTIADRLAERLKNDSLGTLIGEDDLLDICKQAINNAFFVGTPSSYNNQGTPPVVVAMAEKAMKEKVRQYVDDNFEKIINDEKFSEVMGQLMVSALGGVLMDSLRDNWQRQFFTDLNNHSSMIAQIVKNHT